jgi:Zn-dependent protease with chaperone function
MPLSLNSTGMPPASGTNPTDSIDIRFRNYVRNRVSSSEAHLVNGIPDYAYGPDFVMREKIRAMPGAFAFFRAITNQYVPYMKQVQNMNSLRVGPSQFPEVYEMTRDCARRLGIGLPTLYIYPDPTIINAYTLAVEDDSPIIVIHSCLLERFSHGELKAVIGHECGHIHNNHGIYDTAANIILQSMSAGLPILRQILSLLLLPLRYALQAWSRAGEVTCDRAGVICSDDVNDELTSKAKFLYGGAFGTGEINLESILRQYDMIRSTPVRLLELESTHPLPVRRMFAVREFMNSEILYQWRPEWKTPDLQLIGKQELDARCERYVGVLSSRKAEKR